MPLAGLLRIGRHSSAPDSASSPPPNSSVSLLVVWPAEKQGGGEALDVASSHNQGQVIDGTISLDADHQLQRGLKSRHIQFLALGGAYVAIPCLTTRLDLSANGALHSIGTGLFVGSGGILATVGPAPLWLAYLSMMLLVWIVMNCIGEMCTYLPLRGITLPYFTERFVDASLGFAAGWNYW